MCPVAEKELQCLQFEIMFKIKMQLFKRTWSVHKKLQVHVFLIFKHFILNYRISSNKRRGVYSKQTIFC